MDGAGWDSWATAFADYHARFAPYFARAEARVRSRRYLHGLLAPVERKNGWQLAEAMGEDDPQGMQRLLYEAVWDADAVRDAYHRFVIDAFGDPEAILVLDETGFIKKGTHSVGVQRQYSGTAGKVENCQLGGFLAYVTARGHVLLDRRLYLPEGWAADPARRAAAKVPEAVAFHTIPELGLAMLEHARDQGVLHAWVTADERYGGDPQVLAALEAQDAHYVIAVPVTTRVWPDGTTLVDGPRGARILTAPTPCPATVGEVVADWAASAWERLAVGAGAKGPRVYDWAAVRVVASRDQCSGPGRRCGCSPAARRPTPRTSPIIWPTPRRTPRWPCWPKWRRRAGRWNSASRRPRAGRGWTTMKCGSGRAGIGTSPWRCSRTASWPGNAGRRGEKAPPPDDLGLLDGLVPLSVPAIRRLLVLTLPLPPRSVAFHLAWSHWRRRHQARAKRAHYRRRRPHAQALVPI